ncbi:MAG TPA: heme-binding protein, partial [Pseudomonadales bacterium]|nr:heme-binding protein [Pseudomonadales bacterium]
TVTLAYQSGQWTADPQTNNGQLYDANGCRAIIVPEEQTSYPLPGAPMGALVGRINGGSAFLIGDGPYSILSASDGVLELCINDDLTGRYGAGLKDNVGSVSFFIYSANIPPHTSIPLVQEPVQAYPGVPLTDLGPLQYLIGTWTNQNLPDTNQGGPASPYAYNVMPLPQMDPSTPYGYILKNFSYYEELTFSAIHGNVLNRGGKGAQVAYTLFYEQRVYFAEGPNKDALVHAENGTLLYLLDQTQQLGPYGNGDNPGLGNKTVTGSTPPSQDFNLVKQVAVPHGNSILALGNYSSANRGTQSPVIPDASVYPAGVDLTPYHTLDPVSNPQPELTANPNLVLKNALLAKPVTNFISLTVDSNNGSGAVTNIGFEKHHANVSRYSFTYWLESFDNNDNYTQLQYTQTILMQLPVNGKLINFPHVTANTLTKLKTH